MRNEPPTRLEWVAFHLRGPSDGQNPSPWETRVMARRGWVVYKGLESVFWWLAIVALPLGLLLDAINWRFYLLVSPLAFARGALGAMSQNRTAQRVLRSGSGDGSLEAGPRL